jgi:hypothetical protein
MCCTLKACEPSCAGAVGVREVITSAALDEGATTVVMGDSTGHLRVLDISAGIDVSSPEAAAASFKQVGVPALLMGCELAWSPAGGKQIGRNWFRLTRTNYYGYQAVLPCSAWQSDK